MSELRSDAPVRRPETARPRAAAVPEIAPPSAEELERIQRHLCALPTFDGAAVIDDVALRAVVIRDTPAGLGLDHVAMPRWSEDDWQTSLALVVERMAGAGTWPSLLVCDGLDRPPALASRLTGSGWVAAVAETVHWVGHASVVPHLDPAIRIEAVRPQAVDVHEAVERDVFGMAAGLASRRRDLIAAALRSGRLRAYVVWAGDEPVAVARLTQGEGVAGLGGIGVVEPRRREGFGSLVTIVATRAGLALGNRIVWLSVRDDDTAARELYGRLGFRPAFGWSRWFTREGARPARRR